MNDWSARDIQAWNISRSGHFYEKLPTSISPWVVTMEALGPSGNRCRHKTPSRSRMRAKTIPHSTSAQSAAQSLSMDADVITRTNFLHLYWSIAQLRPPHRYWLQPGTRRFVSQWHNKRRD
jgi:fumarylacetoacetase